MCINPASQSVKRSNPTQNVSNPLIRSLHHHQTLHMNMEVLWLVCVLQMQDFRSKSEIWCRRRSWLSAFVVLLLVWGSFPPAVSTSSPQLQFQWALPQALATTTVGEHEQNKWEGKRKGPEGGLGGSPKHSGRGRYVLSIHFGAHEMKPPSIKVSFIGDRVEILTAILSFSLVVSRFGSPKVRRDAEIERLVFVPYFTSQLDWKKQRNKL